MEECAEALTEYGELVNLPVEGKTFVDHLRSQLTDAADRVDSDYLANPYFTITNGRPVLTRLVKKTVTRRI